MVHIQDQTVGKILPDSHVHYQNKQPERKKACLTIEKFNLPGSG